MARSGTWASFSRWLPASSQSCSQRTSSWTTTGYCRYVFAPTHTIAQQHRSHASKLYHSLPCTTTLQHTSHASKLTHPRLYIITSQGQEGYRNPTVRVGDLLVSVDSNPVANLPWRALAALLRGSPYTAVDLTLRGDYGTYSAVVLRNIKVVSDMPDTTTLRPGTTTTIVRDLSPSAVDAPKSAVASPRTSSTSLLPLPHTSSTHTHTRPGAEAQHGTGSDEPSWDIPASVAVTQFEPQGAHVQPQTVNASSVPADSRVVVMQPAASTLRQATRGAMETSMPAPVVRAMETSMPAPIVRAPDMFGYAYGAGSSMSGTHVSMHAAELRRNLSQSRELSQSQGQSLSQSQSTTLSQSLSQSQSQSLSLSHSTTERGVAVSVGVPAAAAEMRRNLSQSTVELREAVAVSARSYSLATGMGACAILHVVIVCRNIVEFVDGMRCCWHTHALPLLVYVTQRACVLPWLAITTWSRSRPCHGKCCWFKTSAVN